MIRLLLFVGLPVVELAILVTVGERIGLAWTLGLIAVTGIVGARVAYQQGRTVWLSFRSRLESGQVPGAELAHGAMVLVGAAFLLTPGFLTDTVGFLLMVPWIRELVRVRFVSGMREFVR